MTLSGLLSLGRNKFSGLRNAAYLRTRIMKPLDILQSGSFCNQKLWVVENVTPKGTVTLTELVWSRDMVREAGVMRRSAHCITAKLKNGVLYKNGVGTFKPSDTDIILKTDRVESLDVSGLL